MFGLYNAGETILCNHHWNLHSINGVIQKNISVAISLSATEHKFWFYTEFIDTEKKEMLCRIPMLIWNSNVSVVNASNSLVHP